MSRNGRGHPHRHPARLLWTAIAVAFSLCVPAGHRAVAAPTEWPFGWRAFWTPGDPMDAPAGVLPPPWAGVSRILPEAPGLLVALDPVTRLPIPPSAAQRRAVAAARLEEFGPSGPPDGPFPVEKLPGRGEVLHLPPGFEIFAVARRDAAGRVTTDCAPAPSVVRRAAVRPAPGPRRWEER